MKNEQVLIRCTRMEKSSIIACAAEHGISVSSYMKLASLGKGWVKEMCHRAFSSAIASGAVTRQPCQVCGEPKSHGHHHDYFKPLDVTWLCQKHHSQEHRFLSRDFPVAFPRPNINLLREWDTTKPFEKRKEYEAGMRKVKPQPPNYPVNDLLPKDVCGTAIMLRLSDEQFNSLTDSAKIAGVSRNQLIKQRLFGPITEQTHVHKPAPLPPLKPSSSPRGSATDCYLNTPKSTEEAVKPNIDSSAYMS